MCNVTHVQWITYGSAVGVGIGGFMGCVGGGGGGEVHMSSNILADQTEAGIPSMNTSILSLLHSEYFAARKSAVPSR